MARSMVCTACVASLASITEPAYPQAPPPSVQHAARFALVLAESKTPIDECGGRVALQEAVERRLERRVFTDEPGGADASLVLSLARLSDAEWQARIAEHDRSGSEVGQRDVAIDADDCQRGVETLAIVLAIMIGPPRMIAGPPPDSPPPSARSEEPPTPAAPDTVPRTAGPRRRPRWTAAPDAAVVAGIGILPSLSWGVAGGFTIHPPAERLSFVARAQFWPARSTETTPKVDFDRFSAALLACLLAARVSRASFDLCTGLDGGRITASAPALDGSAQGASRLLLDVPFQAKVGVVLSPPHRRIRIEPVLLAEVAVLLRRDRFTFQNRMDAEITLHRPAAVAFSAAAGLAVHFF